MNKLVFSYCIFLLSLSLHAEETITIARGDGNYFPFEYIENGILTGIHIDLIQAVADELGLTVKYESLPWRRGLFDFKRGKYDAMSFVSHTEERAKYAHFLEGNIISQAKTYPVVLSHRRNEIAYDGNLTSLTDYTVAVGKGYKYGGSFDSADFLSKYEISTPSQEVLTKLLRLERVDVILSSKRNLLQVHSIKEIDEIYHVYEKPIASNNSYLAFSKTKSKLVIARKFAKALNHYKSSEAYIKLIQDYENRENSLK